MEGDKRKERRKWKRKDAGLLKVQGEFTTKITFLPLCLRQFLQLFIENNMAPTVKISVKSGSHCIWKHFAVSTYKRSLSFNL